MKKKNVGYILFGVGGSGLLSTLVMSFYYRFRINNLLEDLEDLGVSEDFPVKFFKALPIVMVIIGIVTSIILFCVGLILLIKFRERE